MENSFKKDAALVVNKIDGNTIKLSYKSLNHRSLLSIFVIIFWPMLIIWLDLFTFNLGGNFLLPMWLIYVVIVSLYNLITGFIKTNKTITIKVGDGLIFNKPNNLKKQFSLPFSDISSIGVYVRQFGRDITAYVYATSNGTEIRITGFLKKALAEAIHKEIMNNSGFNWN